MAVLFTFGVVFQLSDAILGLTILAWGNSVGGNFSHFLKFTGLGRWFAGISIVIPGVPYQPRPVNLIIFSTGLGRCLTGISMGSPGVDHPPSPVKNEKINFILNSRFCRWCQYGATERPSHGFLSLLRSSSFKYLNLKLIFQKDVISSELNLQILYWDWASHSPSSALS